MVLSPILCTPQLNFRRGQKEGGVGGKARMDGAIGKRGSKTFLNSCLYYYYTTAFINSFGFKMHVFSLVCRWFFCFLFAFSRALAELKTPYSATLCILTQK